jgi:hypothetical protein
MTTADELDEPIEVASPVCYAGDFEPPAPSRHYELGRLVAFLNELLVAERASLRVLRNWSLEAGPDAVVGAWALAAMRDDATRICAQLWDGVAGLGAEPSSLVGPFYDQAMALPTWSTRLRSLDDDFSRRATLIRDALPRIADGALAGLLGEALERHEDARRQLAPALAS